MLGSSPSWLLHLLAPVLYAGDPFRVSDGDMQWCDGRRRRRRLDGGGVAKLAEGRDGAEAVGRGGLAGAGKGQPGRRGARNAAEFNG